MSKKTMQKNMQKTCKTIKTNSSNKKTRKWDVFFFESLPSSNKYLMEHIDEYKAYSCVWTNEQTMGRGRFERKWNSLADKDLTFSVLLPLNNIPQKNWNNITQMAALAIVCSVAEIGLHATIKWPNDVLIDNKKLCGILCELSPQINTETNQKMAVLGIGLNINSTEKDMALINQDATSLFIEYQKTIDREVFLRRLLHNIGECLDDLENDNFEQLCVKIRTYLTHRGKQASINIGTKTHTGSVIDINVDGTLHFLCKECGSMTIHSGELQPE